MPQFSEKTKNVLSIIALIFLFCTAAYGSLSGVTENENFLGWGAFCAVCLLMYLKSKKPNES
jgi:uncharacterized membrane protein